MRMKFTLFLLLFFFGHNIKSQVINQPANWPNPNFIITGTYNGAVAVLPTTNSTFSYDDDADGDGAPQTIISAESPTIDVTAAVSGSESFLKVEADYSYNEFFDLLSLEYFDADLNSWQQWSLVPDNASSISYLNCNISTFTSSDLDISGFTSNQLQNFKYRITYDDNNEWAYGFCFSSPTLTSGVGSGPPPEGSTCDSPIVVSSLPYTSTSNTNLYGDDYSGSPGASGCGSTFSYLNGDDVVYAYTAGSTGKINIDVTNIDDTYAGIFVYGSCADIGVGCLAGDVNGSSTSDLSIPSFDVVSGSTYYIVISTWATPQSVGYTLDITEALCTSPSVSIPTDPIDFANCPSTVDVSLSIDDMGDATSLTINALVGGNPVGTSATATSAGIVTVTGIPVPQSSITFEIVHNISSECNVVLGPFILNCPPDNDDLCGATSLTVDAPPITSTNNYATGETSEPNGLCWFGTSTQNSVWFKFNAPTSGNVEVSTDFDTDLDDTHIAIYSNTNCADLSTLTELGCSEDDGVNTPDGYQGVTTVENLTPGAEYVVQVDGYGTATGEFMIEVTSKGPENNLCPSALLLANGVPGMLSGQDPTGASISNPASDEGGCTFTETGDMYYLITTDDDGSGPEDVSVTVIPSAGLDVALYAYGSCNDLSSAPLNCANSGGTGTPELLVVSGLNFQNDHGSGDRTQDVIIVVKTSGSGTFSVEAAGSALPIQISNFTAFPKGAMNKIDWTTEQEVNSDFQMIEKSIDDQKTWLELGRVKSTNTNSRNNYSMMDENPSILTYYRIHSFDIDGRSQKSNIISVLRNDKFDSKVLSISPIPTNDNLYIQLISAQDAALNLTYYDVTGKILLEQSKQVAKGINNLISDIDVLGTGIYLLQIKGTEINTTKKIVKQ